MCRNGGSTLRLRVEGGDRILTWMGSPDTEFGNDEEDVNESERSA